MSNILSSLERFFVNFVFLLFLALLSIWIQNVDLFNIPKCLGVDLTATFVGKETVSNGLLAQNKSMQHGMLSIVVWICY